jgi:hypothetical protein
MVSPQNVPDSEAQSSTTESKKISCRISTLPESRRLEANTPFFQFQLLAHKQASSSGTISSKLSAQFFHLALLTMEQMSSPTVVTWQTA